MLTVVISIKEISIHLAVSSFLELLNNTYKKITIISHYPDLFYNLREVNRSIKMETSYAYEDYIRNKPVIWINPYMDHRFLNKQIHLYEAVASQFGIPYNTHNPPKPHYPLLDEKYIDEVNNVLKHLNNSPFILTQFTSSNNRLYKEYPKHYVIELIRKLTSQFKGLSIVNIFPGAGKIEGVINLNNIPYQAYPYLLEKAFSFISIDNFLNDFSNMRLISTTGIVLWGATSPILYGYPKNVNLEGDCNEHCMRPYPLPVSDMIDEGKPWQCKLKSCMNIQPDSIIENFIRLLIYKQQK